MKIEEFLIQCNKTPLLKRWRQKTGHLVSKEVLAENDYFRDSYDLSHLKEFSEILNGFQKPIEPPELEEAIRVRKYKDLAHKRLVQVFDNQGVIQQARVKLDMPFFHRGFKIDKIKIYSLLPSYSNTDLTFSKEFKVWFDGLVDRYTKNTDELDKWLNGSTIVSAEVKRITSEVLTKWNLPHRYFEATQELILFNRIIPANSGIKEQAIRNKDMSFSEAIFYDADVTKQELIEYIRKYKLPHFDKHKYTNLRREPRKLEETLRIIEIYNKMKLFTNNEQSIYRAIQREFPDLSISAIRKRIKGK